MRINASPTDSSDRRVGSRAKCPKGARADHPLSVRRGPINAMIGGLGIGRGAVERTITDAQDVKSQWTEQS